MGFVDPSPGAIQRCKFWAGRSFLLEVIFLVIIAALAFIGGRKSGIESQQAEIQALRNELRTRPLTIQEVSSRNIGHGMDTVAPTPTVQASVSWPPTPTADTRPARISTETRYPAGTISFGGVTDKISTVPQETLLAQKEAAAKFEKAVIEFLSTRAPMARAYDRYVDACVGKSTRVWNQKTVQGSENGQGTHAGKIYDGDGGQIQYGGRSNWNSTWSEIHYWTKEVDNSTTPECRAMWSDLVYQMNESSAELKRLVDQAHKEGITDWDELAIRWKFGL